MYILHMYAAGTAGRTARERCRAEVLSAEAATAVPRIARLAEERGLVFFDPQFPHLRVPFRAAWER